MRATFGTGSGTHQAPGLLVVKMIVRMTMGMMIEAAVMTEGRMRMTHDA